MRGLGRCVITRDTPVWSCVLAWSCRIKRWCSQCWACHNDALYSATHPSYTSNVGPTAIIFSRYVDVVSVGQWVVFLETDGRLHEGFDKTQQDLVSLSIICTGNGCVSVYDRVWCNSKDIDSATLLFGKHETWSENVWTEFRMYLSSHRVVQGRTLNNLFYLRAMRLLLHAIRRIDQ
jgi:hypothetical protein